MLRDFSSADKLLEDGTQHPSCGLPPLGEEIAVESYNCNVFSRGLIAQVVNHQGASICCSSVISALFLSIREAFLPEIRFPHSWIPVTEQHLLNKTIFLIPPFSEIVGF